jgi:hypothetical protein
MDGWLAIRRSDPASAENAVIKIPLARRLCGERLPWKT